MADPNLIFPHGTQIVCRNSIVGADGKTVHPAGVVGVVLSAPIDNEHAYRIRLPDGLEVSLRRHEIITLSDYQSAGLTHSHSALAEFRLDDYVIFRCVIGSRAYGLDHADSDTDRRGIYLPPAALHWSLYGVPEQLENHQNQDCYWEIQKFLSLALKANPNILECLYTPMVEFASPLAGELVGMREIFLSKLVYQTYNGYVLSQFKKLDQDIRSRGHVKWKHVMHLIRLLISGIIALRDGYVPVRVENHRDRLIAIRNGECRWEEIDPWRQALHLELEEAAVGSRLPERPDYERANVFLIKCRQFMADQCKPGKQAT